MNIFLYDNTFEGLLSVVFEAFRMKLKADLIAGRADFQSSLLYTPFEVVTDIEKAERVWQGLLKRSDKKAGEMVYHCFLSEMDGIEMLVYQFLKLVFESNYNVSINYREESVLKMKQIQRKVLREAHRMLMFVRFQKTNDNIFFAPIEPNYDVIPLIGRHFKNRFRDQVWIIYDTKRDYGIYYDLKTVEEIKLTLENISKASGKINASLLEEKEETYQILWKSYFDAINIKERKNLKVQMQFMPKRFWHYLPEKNN
ncbi:MAG: TIGR03915 family putative DNA repair protein [Bacteroidetes bacterium]|nr:TIGR03915 family putative DNA repair protein [Bacteroidota bacterium]